MRTFVERHYPIVREWFANQFNEIKVQKWVQSNPIIQTKSVLQHNHSWKTVCWLSVTPLTKSKSERDKRSNTQNCTEIRTQKNNSYILDSTSNMHKKHKQYDRLVSKTLCMYLKSLISLNQFGLFFSTGITTLTGCSSLEWAPALGFCSDSGWILTGFWGFL